MTNVECRDLTPSLTYPRHRWYYLNNSTDSYDKLPQKKEI